MINKGNQSINHNKYKRFIWYLTNTSRIPGIYFSFVLTKKSIRFHYL